MMRYAHDRRPRTFAPTSTLLLMLALLTLASACKDNDGRPESVTKLSAEQLERAAKQDPSKPLAKAPGAEKDAEQKPSAPSALDAGTEEQQELLVRAKALFLGNRLTAAAPLFEELAKSEPLSGPVVSATIALGDIYAQEGKNEEALALYEALLKRDVQVAEVFLVVARAYQRLDKPKEAIYAYEQALRLQPYYIFIHAELGAIYAGQGQNEDSAKAYLAYEARVYELAKQLEDPKSTTPSQRLDISDTFSYLEDDRVTQALLKAAKSDPETLVRMRAVRALGENKAVAALPELKALYTQEKDHEVSKALTDTLKVLEGITPAPTDAASPTVVEPEPDAKPEPAPSPKAPKPAKTP